MTHENESTASDEVERIERALRAMPARSRAIFLLHRSDGLSYVEIAERCGISEKDVERHIAKAMLHLDRELSGKRWPWWQRWLDRWL